MGFLKLDEEHLENKKSDDIDVEAVAIIGISFDLPHATSLKQLWEIYENEENISQIVPPNRKRDLINFLDDNSSYTPLKCRYLKNIDLFDSDFFGISGKEADLMDPRQRLFLQNSWSAIVDAGYDRDSIYGTNTGVYAGISELGDYNYIDIVNKIDPSSKIIAINGNTNSMIPSRLSYIFNLKGPSILFDTACSSTMTALINAVQDLQSNRIDIAVIGGVKVYPLPVKKEVHLGIESPDGITRSFDNLANGTGIGEGAVSIVLKKLSQAENSGDSIYGVIKGVAINNDGKSMGLSAPNVDAQAEVIKTAIKKSKLNPKDINYIEAHGTGTKLGDPIEISALKKVFGNSDIKFCGIGASKTNFGHTYDLSALVGLLKILLIFNKRKIPKTLNFKNLNREIDLTNSPFYIVDNLYSLENISKITCGLSSFGFSGTNGHIILQEYKGDHQISKKVLKNKCIYRLNRHWVTPLVKDSFEEDIPVKVSHLLDSYDSIISTKLSGIWSEILGVNKLDINDSFISLGGDSILAIKLSEMINSTFNIELSVADIMGNSTFNEQVKMINLYQKERMVKEEEHTEVKHEDEKTYELSSTQYNLYTQYIKESKSIKNNVTCLWEIDSNVNLIHFQRALLNILARHNILNNRFFEKNGKIFQTLQNSVLNISSVYGQKRDLDRIINNFISPFDLKKDRLYRILFLEFEDYDNRFILLDMHHIVCDGISNSILLQEIITEYTKGNSFEKELSNNNHRCDTIIEFNDFIRWQKQYYMKNQFKRDKEYWKDYLSKNKLAITESKLPSKLKSSDKTVNSINFSIIGNRMSKLKAWISKLNVTNFAFFLSLFSIAICKWNKHSTVTVNYIDNGRPNYQFENTVGPFINTLLAIEQINVEKTFIDIIKDTQKLIIEHSSFKNYPYNLLYSEAKKINNLYVPELTFVYQNFLKNTVNQEFKVKYLEPQDIPSSMYLEVIEKNDKFVLNLSFKTEFYSEDSINSLVSLFKELVQEDKNFYHKPITHKMDDDIEGNFTFEF